MNTGTTISITLDEAGVPKTATVNKGSESRTFTNVVGARIEFPYYFDNGTISDSGNVTLTLRGDKIDGDSTHEHTYNYVEFIRVT